MEGKLIKTENGYGLKDCELIAFVSSRRPEHKHHKLSLKNCQAIEHGYDLEDIKRKVFDGFDGQPDSFTIAAVERTIQIMVELMGDKKFSEQDMYKMFIYGRSIDTAKKHIKKLEDKPMDEFFNDFIQSLQKTEWDVTFDPDELDAEGRLILKRKP